jgi:hypothetical protein
MLILRIKNYAAIVRRTDARVTSGQLCCAFGQDGESLGFELTLILGPYVT